MGYATSQTSDLDSAICQIYEDLSDQTREEFADELWNVIEKYEKKAEALR